MEAQTQEDVSGLWLSLARDGIRTEMGRKSNLLHLVIGPEPFFGQFPVDMEFP
jgi:hypothetical protein